MAAPPQPRAPLALLLALLLLGARPAAAGPRLAGALEQGVASARRAAGQVAVRVVDLGDGRAVFEHDADRLLVIASNTKLFTTAAALELLGPGYFFETRLLARGELRQGELVGELAVVGGGDPNISGRHTYGDSLAVLRDWGRALARLGVRSVTGDVYLVDGLFSGPEVHPDWPRDQLARWYEAPISALSFNDNCILVRVRAATPGRPPVVETVPDLPVVEIRSSVRTVAGRRGDGVIIDRPAGGSVVRVSGNLTARGVAESWVTVDDPVAYFGAALARALEEEGIRLAGRRVPRRDLPDGQWREVAVHRSDLLTTVEVTNKRSQNFYAESLLKTMGARLCGEGSWRAGVEVVKEFITGLGVPSGSFSLADGSGLSRNDRFSARAVTRLLEVMHGAPRGRELMRSLPFSGEEGGGWERRLAEPPYRGNVFAKTGSLAGVSALSGYAKARSGRLYAFSILLNQARSQAPARAAEDRIVRAIVDEG